MVEVKTFGRLNFIQEAPNSSIFAPQEIILRILQGQAPNVPQL